MLQIVVYRGPFLRAPIKSLCPLERQETNQLGQEVPILGLAP